MTITTRTRMLWMLVAHALLVAGIALRTTPNVDEPAHLAAGIYHWQTGRFDAFRVNPPFVRLWAAVPSLLLNSPPAFQSRSIDDGSRLEWQLDNQLCQAWTHEQLCWGVRAGRLTLIPFALLGGYIVWRWASEIHGVAAGWAAWCLWIACPNLLAWSATICPDVHATSLGVASSYCFWRQISQRKSHYAPYASLLAGLAILSKSTWLILVPAMLIGVITLDQSIRRCPAHYRALGRMFVITVIVINLGYAFSLTGRPCRQLTFRSRLFSKVKSGFRLSVRSGDSLGRLPCPLPADFVLGIDRQRLEFENGKQSYLAGKWRCGSWYHYYAACAIWKLPCGFLICGILGGLAILRQHTAAGSRRAHEEDHWSSNGTRFVVVLMLTFALVISAQRGLGHHFRYAFPCLPYFYLAACRAVAPDQWSAVRWVTIVAIAWGVISSLSVWPRSHSYFNELATRCCAEPPLLDSNLDWGEDLDLIAAWAERNTTCRPIFHAVTADDLAAHMPMDWNLASDLKTPGWYIVSRQRILEPGSPFARLRTHTPRDQISSSLGVYRISRPM